MDYRMRKILIFFFITNVRAQQFFNTMPPPVNTNFTCKGRDTGFYADLETNCRVYHMCDENGNKFTYYCPAETAFRQEALVCDHAHLVDCANGRRISKIEQPGQNNRENVERKLKNDGKYTPSFSSMDSSSSKDEKMAEDRRDSFQPGSSNSAYTRSFRITQEPKAQVPTPPAGSRQKPTFVLSSSVFLHDRTNLKKSPSISRNNRFGIMESSMDSNDSEESGEDVPEKEESEEGYSRIFPSAMSPTTPRSSREGFRMKEDSGNPPIHRSSNFHAEEEITEAYPGKFFSPTTKKPFSTLGENNRGNSDDPRGSEKFKLRYGNSGGNLKNFATRTEHADEKIISSKGITEFRFEEKPPREKKLDTNHNFQTNPRIGEGEFNFDKTEKNREPTGRFFDAVQKDPTTLKNWERFDKSYKELKISVHEQPPFFHDDSNFPYSETLRSMQEMARKNSSTDQSAPPRFSSSTTSSPTTTAGTEFPVFSFATNSPSEPNDLDDDPYYPKRPTATEAYYKLSNLKENRKSSRFPTKRPWPGSLNFEIPEVLPDLNTLDDLVDRRKLFYIPRLRAT